MSDNKRESKKPEESELQEAKLLLEMEKRLNEAKDELALVKDQLQSFSLKRRNEAIVIAVGLLTIVATILNLTGKQAIEDQVKVIIGETAKKDAEANLKSIQKSSEDADKAATELLNFVSQTKETGGLKWKRIPLNELDSNLYAGSSDLYYSENISGVFHIHGYLRIRHTRYRTDIKLSDSLPPIMRRHGFLNQIPLRGGDGRFYRSPGYLSFEGNQLFIRELEHPGGSYYFEVQAVPSPIHSY